MQGIGVLDKKNSESFPCKQCSETISPHCSVLRFNFMSFARYRNKHSAAYPPQKFLIFMMNASCLVRTQFYLFAFFAHIIKEKRRKNECDQG